MKAAKDVVCARSATVFLVDSASGLKTWFLSINRLRGVSEGEKDGVAPFRGELAEKLGEEKDPTGFDGASALGVKLDAVYGDAVFDTGGMDE